LFLLSDIDYLFNILAQVPVDRRWGPFTAWRNGLL